MGSAQGSPSVSVTTNTWTIPNGSLRVGQDNVFVIVQGSCSCSIIVHTISESEIRSYGVRLMFSAMMTMLTTVSTLPRIVETSSKYTPGYSTLSLVSLRYQQTVARNLEAYGDTLLQEGIQPSGCGNYKATRYRLH